MEDTILVFYDPFAMESSVYVKKGGASEGNHVASAVDQLAEYVVQLAYEYDVYDLKICAPYAITNEIRRLVENSELKHYSLNKINIEGI